MPSVKRVGDPNHAFRALIQKRRRHVSGVPCNPNHASRALVKKRRDLVSDVLYNPDHAFRALVQKRRGQVSDVPYNPDQDFLAVVEQHRGQVADFLYNNPNRARLTETIQAYWNMAQEKQVLGNSVINDEEVAAHWPRRTGESVGDYLLRIYSPYEELLRGGLQPQEPAAVSESNNEATAYPLKVEPVCGLVEEGAAAHPSKDSAGKLEEEAAELEQAAADLVDAAIGLEEAAAKLKEVAASMKTRQQCRCRDLAVW